MHTDGWARPVGFAVLLAAGLALAALLAPRRAAAPAIRPEPAQVVSAPDPRPVAPTGRPLVVPAPSAPAGAPLAPLGGASAAPQGLPRRPPPGSGP